MEPSIELTAEGLWSEVSSRLRGALNETTYRTWFDHVEGLELGENEFVLAVPNDFTRDWIEGHFVGLISAAAGDATGRERRIQLVVAETQGGELPEAVEVHRRETASVGLNPKYTFDSFVIGSSNRFAHAAALAVAEAPAQAYNPLFIYGGT
ncbi:MAG TPA: DnaA/Hda family protein, partial [Gaiellaceae bacterium]